MSSSQLDILALEPFYGGVRKSMLETLIRCSRHRWTLLKLPPRRLERRLSVAAHWFSETVRSHEGNVDLVFTSEAMNLADFLNLTPQLANKPSVVYFHENQLPDPRSPEFSSLTELSNLSTGMASTEMWFNSTFHLITFTQRAAKMVERHQELSSRNPMPELIQKFRLMPPPLDLQLADHIQQGPTPVKRQARAIFVDTREADLDLLNRGLATLKRRGQRFALAIMGPQQALNKEFPRVAVSEVDDVLQIQEMLRCGIFLSTSTGCLCDYQAIRAISAGCHPIFPTTGFYREIMSLKAFPQYFYDMEADDLASRIQDAWHLEPPENANVAMARAMKPFDAISACKAIDERLEELFVAQGGTGN